ncbi:MAG: hypothetical protein JRG81_03060, partial [Deltaproteobacteria bacterium]|nr:hypothetical protein [Deltaproteobacteria bacterium]
MSEPLETDNSDDYEVAKKLVEAEEGIGRKPEGVLKYLIPAVAVAWSFFQLSI